MQVKAIKTAPLKVNELTLEDFLDKYMIELPEKSVVGITSKVVSLCEGAVVVKDSISRPELIKKEADFYLEEMDNDIFLYKISHDILYILVS